MYYYGANKVVFISYCLYHGSALEAASLLGGEDLEPFYAMLDGGRNGEFFAELEDFFYYAQIRRYQRF